MLNRFIFISLFVLIAVFFSSAMADSNVLTNPGFERGRDAWFDRTCAIEWVSSPVHSGTGAGKAYNRLMNWQGIKQSLFGKLVPGKPYKISGWVRLDNAKCDTVAISVEQQDDSGTKYIGVARGAATDSAWVQLSGEFVLNESGTLSVLDVYFEGPAPHINFYVDDVSVYGPEVDAPPAIPVEPEGKAIIDISSRLQKIEGFGCSAAYYTNNLIAHKKKNELYKLLFKDLGLDILRIGNYYKSDSTEFNSTLVVAREGEAALGRDLKIMISSWSPPPYLKSNGKIIGGTLKKVNGKFDYEGFADWWAGSVVSCTEAGVKVDYINIQNEPDYEAPWNSCVFAMSEEADTASAGYNRAFEAVWQKMNSRMGSKMPKMLAPETSSLGNAKRYIEKLENPAHVYGYAEHLYDCSGCGSAPDRFIPSMSSFSKFVAQHGDKPSLQTEFEDKPDTWTNAINAARVINNALTIAHMSAYLYWDLFWETGSGLVSLDNDSTYTIKPAYYTFKQYSAFIDAGWQRVETSTDNAGIRISAFISPDSKKVTAVMINTTDSTDIAIDLTVKSYPAVKGEVYRSSKTENCVLAGKYDAKKQIKLPANSVTTLVLTPRKK